MQPKNIKSKNNNIFENGRQLNVFEKERQPHFFEIMQLNTIKNKKIGCGNAPGNLVRDL